MTANSERTQHDRAGLRSRSP